VEEYVIHLRGMAKSEFDALPSSSKEWLDLAVEIAENWTLQ